MSIDKLKRYVLKKLENELSEKLTYHGVYHTKNVLRVCQFYAKRMNIPDNDAYLLYTAALIHDTGFIHTYDNHEERSILYAREILPDWNYSQQEIDIIAGIIWATKIPQQASTILEQVIGDADLDYLGTDLFYPVGKTLYNELKAFNKISNEEEWDKLQVRFLQNHQFHTTFAKTHREPIKQKYLLEIRNKWDW